jgi:hypothetical protein
MLADNATDSALPDVGGMQGLAKEFIGGVVDAFVDKVRDYVDGDRTPSFSPGDSINLEAGLDNWRKLTSQDKVALITERIKNVETDVQRASAEELQPREFDATRFEEVRVP